MYYLAMSLVLLATAGGDFVPFAIPLEPNLASPIWCKSPDPIQTDGPRLIGRQGRFWYRDKAIRLWGVNLSFAANFPTHQDAVKVAARMAAAGVNAVRCHHMDTSTWPNGIWDAADPSYLSAEALDRLDFFINELASGGIMVDLNLHVGRAHSRYLGLPQPNTDYDKIVGIFTPALIEAQKRFARDLLAHRNPYRAGLRYADDPAIAIVEITNEDSFFMWSGDQDLRSLPPYYAQILQAQFNDYLRAKYGSNQALAAAWAKDVEPLGQDALINGSLTSGAKGWRLEQHNSCQARLTNTTYKGKQALQVQILLADGTDWHLQLNQGDLRLEAGSYYTVQFKAAAAGPRSIVFNVGQDHQPWKTLGLWRIVDLKADWQTFALGFVATEGDQDARVNFAFGNDQTTLYLADVQFRSGGQVALATQEDLDRGTVELFQPNECTARILDRLSFLAQTEKEYFDGMWTYIREELGCRALVTGTIVFGPLGLYAQSQMDFIDSHAYWQHPSFPGRPWDPGNWIVEQVAMTDHSQQATLWSLAIEHLAGKPHTVSEYNHPAPNDYQAECIPLIATFALAQDWDGVWLYTYSHSNDQWDRQVLNSYFDIDTNPAKWGFMPAGAFLFAGQQAASTGRSIQVGLVDRSTDVLSGLARLHLRYDRDLFAAASNRVPLDIQTVLASRISVALSGSPSVVTSEMAHPQTIQWAVTPEGHGVYYAAAASGWVCVGHAEIVEDYTRGRLKITRPSFAAVALTALDGKDLLASRRLLVTACGRCENQGMGFSTDRRTVGRDWGAAPVQIEAVTGRISLPWDTWTCHALGPDGSWQVQIDIDNGVLELGPQYKTMWYLLSR